MRIFYASPIARILAAVLSFANSAFAQQRIDILISNGSIVDGSGGPARRADIGITGDRITFIGNAASAGINAGRRIDAAGLIVAPGFIDPHTHTLSDLSTSAGRPNLGYLMQGVTTVVTNNDGGGTIEIGRTLDAWDRDGIGTNAALYVPQGDVRRQVLGMSAVTPNAQQMDSMRAIVARGMNEGALGLSTGLYYAPGSFSPTEEVIALARIAARFGGIYDSHMRDESSYTIGLIGSINETLRIARDAHIPVHISHIKALGADVWGQADTVIALIRSARTSGLSVTADQYPYLASGTSVGASLLPRWAEEGGADSLRWRILDAATRPRLVGEMERNLTRRGGAASLLITSTRDTSILGRNLEQIATARHVTPVEAALQIILAGGAGVASFNMTDTDVDRFMIEPWVMTGSDGSAGHPRKFGTFPRKLHEYVLAKKILTLPAAVHVSSQLTAETLSLTERGLLHVGQFADVIVFDTSRVMDNATYLHPEVLASGMHYVIVNGRVVIDGGTYTGVLAGRALRHVPSPK